MTDRLLTLTALAAQLDSALATLHMAHAPLWEAMSLALDSKRSTEDRKRIAEIVSALIDIEGNVVRALSEARIDVEVAEERERS